MCAFKGEHLVQTVSYIEITFKDVICTYLYKRHYNKCIFVCVKISKRNERKDRISRNLLRKTESTC